MTQSRPVKRKAELQRKLRRCLPALRPDRTCVLANVILGERGRAREGCKRVVRAYSWSASRRITRSTPARFQRSDSCPGGEAANHEARSDILQGWPSSGRGWQRRRHNTGCVSARESRKLASCPKHVANSAPTPLARDPRTRIRASTPADRGMDAKCRARRACGRKNSPGRAFACGARPLANFARPTESRPRPFLARFPGESEPRASQRFKVL